jgi:hypothetical protein
MFLHASAKILFLLPVKQGIRLPILANGRGGAYAKSCEWAMSVGFAQSFLFWRLVMQMAFLLATDTTLQYLLTK